VQFFRFCHCEVFFLGFLGIRERGIFNDAARVCGSRERREVESRAHLPLSASLRK
jgi:hypothetical protein